MNGVSTDDAVPKPLPLPRFRCHKVVEASEILTVYEAEPALLLDPYPEDVSKPTVRYPVSVEWLKKHSPQPGGFLVRYEPDGYESYSPEKPFRDGYTRLEPDPEPLRALDGHKVNPANDCLDIIVTDEPGAGGAHHAYHIGGYDLETNPSKHHLAGPQKPHYGTSILFQNGPINEVGVNGVTQEALMEICIDRLRSFQNGPYACDENAEALSHLLQAREALLSRTRARMERGVEGTHEK